MRDWIAATVCLLLALQCSQGVQLKLGGALLPNNSLVDPSRINETTPLVCWNPCCENVNWTLPNGTQASDYQIDNTSLAWPDNTEVPSGIYSCTTNNNSVYVGIYNTNNTSNNGNLITGNLTLNSSVHTLTCVSRGGPVTTIVWLRDNTSLDQLDQSTVITDTETGTYVHTLTLVDPSSGQYQCVVENALGNVSSTLELQLCEEGSLRLIGEFADTVLQICRNNVWFNVAIDNTVRSDKDQFPLQITATDTQITMQWNSSEESAYRVVCSNGTVSIVSVTEEQQVVFSAIPATCYRCCVSVLSNQSGSIYTEHAQSCRTVETQPGIIAATAALPLTILEIVLIASGGILLILLIVALFCCCACTFTSRKKKTQYEVELREQSKHYTKQRIRLMTRPPSETGVTLTDVGAVLFNRSAQELEESHTFTPAQSRSNLGTSSSQDKESSNHLVTDQEEEAANPMYGRVAVKRAEDEAANPMYGRVVVERAEDEAANPMYGRVAVEGTEDELENPLYGRVRS